MDALPPSDPVLFPDAAAHTSFLRVIDLGRMAYAPALEVQRRVNEAVVRGHEPASLLLVEHDPVITISHRREAGTHLLASRRRLDELGIDVQTTDRGGDITYHGPGQLVAYPILRLNPLGLNLSRYMRTLEQIVIDTLTCFGIPAQRDEKATGVWVRTNPGGHANELEKICAMGVRIRKNTTMHGLAINVEPDLTHFQTIVPCGLHDRSVTSMKNILGQAAPTLSQVKQQLARQTHTTLDLLAQGSPPPAYREQK